MSIEKRWPFTNCFPPHSMADSPGLGLCFPYRNALTSEDRMAEQETQETQDTADTAAAVEEQEFEYPITIEDAGPATKRVSIEIPPERISAKLEEQYKELRQQAAIPGFRPGHAPQKLI